MIAKKTGLLFFGILTTFYSNAQIGGRGVFKFLELPVSSRTASLGGVLNSVKDEDLTLAFQNPGLLNPLMHNHFEISYIDYFANINFGTVAYAYHIDSIGTFYAGMQYIDYGDIIKADEIGNMLGTFSAGEYSYQLGYGNQWKRFSYGAQAKYIYSHLESYISTGWAFDLGGQYQNKSGLFTTALVIKNIGQQSKPYSQTWEPLPFEVQAGVSEKLKHLPLRVSLTLQHLEVFDMTYVNTNAPVQTDLTTGQVIQQKTPFSEKIARHMVFGAELNPGKSFFIRFGYNHQRRKELAMPDFRGFVGFSYGFGIRISKFNISYGRATYHLGSASNTFTLTTNFSEFFKRHEKSQEGDNESAPAPQKNN